MLLQWSVHEGNTVLAEFVTLLKVLGSLLEPLDLRTADAISADLS
jgi:hypothetical protein